MKKEERDFHVAGFIRFAVDPTGEKTWVVDYTANDLRMQTYFDEFVGENANDLIDMNEVIKINPDIKNCLLLVTFSYQSVPSFNGEITEYDDETTVRDVIVLDNNYKEQWRINLTTMYEYNTPEEMQSQECQNDLAEWEEFYDEDFEFFKPKPVSLLNLESLIK